MNAQSVSKKNETLSANYFLDLHKNMSLITFHLFVRLFIYESYLFFLIAVDGVTLVLAPLGLR